MLNPLLNSMAKQKRSPYNQGIYKPIHPEKCMNSKKGGSIEYRSQLEFNYMYKVDRSKNVTSWGSEVVWVPYYNPVKKKICQYWVDLLVDHVTLGVIAIEIKPAKEIKAIMENKMPKATPKKKKSTLIYETKMFVINRAKWEAAKQYCNKRGWKFITISEKDLKSGNIPFI